MQVVTALTAIFIADCKEIRANPFTIAPWDLRGITEAIILKQNEGETTVVRFFKVVADYFSVLAIILTVVACADFVLIEANSETFPATSLEEGTFKAEVRTDLSVRGGYIHDKDSEQIATVFIVLIQRKSCIVKNKIPDDWKKDVIKHVEKT